MSRHAIAISTIVLLIITPWSSSVLDLTSVDVSNSYYETDIFNQSGFYEDGVYTSSDGEVQVSRPDIQWTTTNFGLISLRTGACSVAIDYLEEVWLMGGRMDPSPTQSGDEEATGLVEKMDNVNKSWMPAETNMPIPQQYCEAELVGDSIYIVGDWNRNSNPYESPVGRGQIYNITTDTWSNGTSMPENNGRGLGSMAKIGTKLYYAGGIRSSTANDATNRTYEYDTENNSWLRMADMNQPRASFELVNFHDKLYAIGGFQGSQTWNRQALDYVEMYDSENNTWTNLSSLPVGMFGWGGTVLNDEIILVGGFNGGPKKTVYHYNPIESTWRQDANSIVTGTFDLTVEEINGSVVWASGDKSNYPYNSWGQTLSDDTEYQNYSSSHTGIITSSVIDLRPNQYSKATPVEFELQGSNTVGGEIEFQFRSGSDSNSLGLKQWRGIDSTGNTTYPIGTTDLDLVGYANFIQYRIMMNVYDLENWDEPDLDRMIIKAEHAGFQGAIPSTFHPRGNIVTLQTTHDIHSTGYYSLDFASCTSSGAVTGSWSSIYIDNNGFNQSDSQRLFSHSFGIVNSTNIGGTTVDWSISFGDLNGVSNLCMKTSSVGSKITEYQYPNPIPIDNRIDVRITDLGDYNNGDAIIGGVPINVGIDYGYNSSGDKMSSGNLQARLTFSIREVDIVENNFSGYLNQTTPWNDLNITGNNSIIWTLPSNITGTVDISMEARSDNPLQITCNDNSSMLVLDNRKPVIMHSIPSNGSYIDSRESRHISVQIGDNTGFSYENSTMVIWVEGLDDGAISGTKDKIAQEPEFREINFTLEHEGNFWWFNSTQQDNVNNDQEFVLFKIIGTDKVGNQIMEDYISYQTRNPRKSAVEGIYNLEQSSLWEVAQSLSLDFEVSDDNGISDLISMQIEFGGDSQFGLKYYVADSTCSVLDTRIDSDNTLCSHRIENQNMIISLVLVASWEIDLSILDEGKLDVILEDRDGISVTPFQNLWTYSNQFDLYVSNVSDKTGPIFGNISNTSILMIGDEIRITGDLIYSISQKPYQGLLSINWWGSLQGANWFGAGFVDVENGIINTTIVMPNTGGIIDFDVSFMSPISSIEIGTLEIPTFIIDDSAPIIMPPDITGHSRYHLDNFEINVKVEENVAWTGDLTLSCQVKSTEVEWAQVTNSSLPKQEFRGTTLFSFEFDFSNQGDPSTLSPEAEVYCWAYGIDDSGFNLINPLATNQDSPWLLLPLSSVGPNIELVEVKIDGNSEPGSDIRIEISIQNTGESLEDSFNVSVYTITGEDRTLASRYNQAKISSGQGITKRIIVNVPEGDWSLQVVIDEEQNIWELNEDDNTFSKQFSGEKESGFSTLAIIGISILIIITAIAFLLKTKGRRGTSILSTKFNAEESTNIVENKIEAKSRKPLRGPPPKKIDSSTNQLNIVGLDTAIEKLGSLSQGVSNPIKVSSYEYLPGGGQYDYSTGQTIYSGKDIGRWKLEDDGSFTKLE